MDDWVLDARVDQIRSFVSVLGALKLSKRQLVHVSVAERGVTVVAQDPSKSLQAQVNFRAETFASYRVNASAAGTQGHVSGVGSAVGTFGLDLGSLIDVLNAFAPLDGECELSMRWPDRDNSLVLAALTVRDAADPHAGRPARMCTHASIAPEVDGWSTTSAADAELVFRGERNAFAMPTTALREIVDDLEWPCAPMTIAMSSHPSPSAVGLIHGSQDISYMLISGFFVFFMQAGFAMLCAGSVRSKNVMNILIKNVLDACIGCLAYFCFGYAISYGTKNSNSFSGEFAGEGWFFLAKGDHDAAFDTWHVFFFQWAFTAAAATITSGAMAERTAFQAYIAYSIVLSGFVYPVVVHWIWDTAGWLCNWKTDKDGNSDLLNDVGMHDFAGSGVVHMTGGIAGLMGAAIVGPRTGRFDASGRPMAMPGHNAALVVLGTFILWVGWYGFNPGSVLMIHATNAVTVARVCVTTTLAAASGGIGAMILNYSLYKVWDLVAVCNGCLAGLVSITAGACVLQPWSAILAGFVGSVVLWASSKLLLKLRIDDPLEAFPVHGACGAWGVIAVGLFADQQLLGDYMGNAKADQKIYGAFLGGGGKLLGNQILGIVVITLWVGTTIGGLFFALKTVGMLRASAEEEAAGLDESKHGGSAYNMEPSKV